MNSEKTYEDGLVDGRLKNLEDVTLKHSKRLDRHSKRIYSLERVAWVLLGGFALIKFLPALGYFVGFLNK